MNPVAKALWFVESHFAGEVSLDDIAGIAGVSRFQLSRVFGMATGHSVMGYLRARRLTEAARSLANGAPDILAVALDAGYSSHEAFTRAFRDQFGLTPEALRARGRLDNIQLVEAIKMDATLNATLAPPRIENHKALLVAGLAERFDCKDSAGIPALWQRFAPYLGNVRGQVGKAAFGVTTNSDDSGLIEYLCGVEVSDFSGLPDELSRLRIPDQKYAVFFHRGHVSALRSSCIAIMNEWVPKSGYQAVDAPFFERYGENFDARSGSGGVEIWVPIKT